MTKSMDDRIVDLCLRAIHDPDAREVFVDACLERGPSWSVKVDPPQPVLRLDGQVQGFTVGSVCVEVDGTTYALSYSKHGDGDLTMRALASVLLFRDWSLGFQHLPWDERGDRRWPWPVVRRALRSIVPTWLRTTVEPPSGAYLDVVAEHVYGIVRGARETDAELLARCIRAVEALSPRFAAPPTRRFRLTFSVAARTLTATPEDRATADWLVGLSAEERDLLSRAAAVLGISEKVAADRPPAEQAARYARSLGELFPDDRFEVEPALDRSGAP